MKAIEFPEQTVVLAKDQPEYQPLPVHRSTGPESCCVSCWQLSPEEVELIGRTRKIWLSQMTFGQAPMPLYPTIRKNELFNATDQMAPVEPFRITHNVTIRFDFWDLIKMLVFRKSAYYLGHINVDREVNVVDSSGKIWLPRIIERKMQGLIYPPDNKEHSND